MEYTQRIVTRAVLLLLGVTGVSALLLLPFGLSDGLIGVGLVGLVFSAVQSVVMLIVSAVIFFSRADGDAVVEPEEDTSIVDQPKPTPRTVGYRRRAGSYLLAAILVLLIGGSLCFGAITFGDLNIH